MSTLRIGLFVIDGITLEQVTPVRERLEQLGAEVIMVVPTGGSILPVSGRYFAAAGGRGVRRAPCQLTAGELDLLLLPAGVTGDKLAACPEILRLIQGRTGETVTSPVPVFTVGYLAHLLDRQSELAGLARPQPAVVTGGARR